MLGAIVGERPEHTAMTTPASDDMPTPEWWDEIRVPVAFLVAPAMVPLYLCIIPNSFSVPGVDPLIIVLASILSYLGTFVIGIPLYLALRAWNLTAFWVAPIVGILVGGCLGSLLPDDNFSHAAQRFGVVVGVLVAMVLWLIARPDRRRTQPPSRGQGARQHEA
jgi:uncharacterized membrane protein YfcA